ncbi:MAG: hypothetical protein L6R28_18190 [Planctomycetes bacterium]|nr:hypothetical protein [Planctomycetota bacterium]
MGIAPRAEAGQSGLSAMGNAEVSREKIRLKLSMPLQIPVIVANLLVGDDDYYVPAELKKAAEAHGPYILEHLFWIRDEGQGFKQLDGHVVSVKHPDYENPRVDFTTLGQLDVIYEIEYALPGPPAQLIVKHLLLDGLEKAPGVPWFLILQLRIGQKCGGEGVDGGKPRSLTLEPGDSKPLSFTWPAAPFGETGETKTAAASAEKTPAHLESSGEGVIRPKEPEPSAQHRSWLLPLSVLVFLVGVVLSLAWLRRRGRK